jgi:uncharacterized protein (DUF58 family)
MAKIFNVPDNFKLAEPKTWFRIAKPTGAVTQLSRRHIYILPTRFGWLYAMLLIALLTGAINYSLSLGFAMTFLLAGMGAISMLHTWRNLANLQISIRRATPVFAGETAVFELVATEENNRARYAVNAKFTQPKSADPEFTSLGDDYQDIAALGEGLFKLALPSQKRGWLKAPRVIFSTQFPVSLFHVWAYAEIESQCLIYPKPSLRSQVIPNAHDLGSSGHHRNPQGDDDFAGHRNYQFGDSPKRVDWKASSREQGLLTKQFEGEAISTLWLDWAATTGENTELRISQLTRWVMDAEHNHLQYGLRLPHLQITPNTGNGHYHQCLTALALM